MSHSSQFRRRGTSTQGRRQPRDPRLSEDDANSGRCPICKHKEPARFDASGDEGELGVGLTAGPLYYVNEIEEVLQRARLSWVQSVRATGKRKAPRWIMKERGLQDYVDALGGLGGFDLEEYDSDEDAADNLRQYTDTEHVRARGPLQLRLVRRKD